MPGFRINNTSGAAAGKDHIAEFRRKHRWRLTVLEGGPVTPADFLYLSKAARPQFKIEPAVVHHDQEEAYFAGKQTWEPLSLEFYDAVSGAGITDISAKVYNWVNIATQIPAATVAVPSAYKKTLQIELTDGVGGVDETWILYGTWVADSNWNELDYSSSDIQLVTLSVKFDRAERST